MNETENIEYATYENHDITVSVCPELLEYDDMQNELWGICLRIENNSDQRIRLVRKELRITDCCGRNYFDCGNGFHGELPDLEPNECFEYEDTFTMSKKASVLYGSCYALTAENKEIEIPLPFMEIEAKDNSPFNMIKTH